MPSALFGLLIWATTATSPAAANEGSRPIESRQVGRAAMNVEHVPLSAAPQAVEVDSLGGRVLLRGVSELVVQRVAKLSRLCPRTVRLAEGGPLHLQCVSRRVVGEVKGAQLRLQTTLAAPMTTDDSAPPAAFYDPVAFNLGGPCPGDTPSARGECALARGDNVAAARALREVWLGKGLTGARLKPGQAHESYAQVGRTSPGFAHAALRLGDLAWIAGDIDSAAGWYDRAGAGTFARVAASRLCELATDCLDGPTDRVRFDPWDDGGLPESVARELSLRRARAFAFQDRTDDSVRHLLRATSQWPNLCDDAPALCRRLAAEALRARDGRDAPAALALALTMTKPFEGPGSLTLSRAVLSHTDRLGAPLFGANVMAAVSAQVPWPELSSHLAGTAERYLNAGDAARADIVMQFANERHLSGTRRWHGLRKRRATMDETTEATRDVTARATPKAAAKATSTTAPKAAPKATEDQAATTAVPASSKPTASIDLTSRKAP